MNLRKQNKINEAKIRQRKHNELSITEKLQKLDKRLGIGIGAKKERERLNNNI